MGRKTLVLGGIRSGKSAFAEKEAASAGNVTYVATGSGGDEEMAARIARHQERRPPEWALVEESVQLGGVLLKLSDQTGPHATLLIDCMSLWLSNLLFSEAVDFDLERASFLQALSRYPGAVVIVSNEVGLGTVGMDPLTRRFCDELGLLNQDLAGQCDRVIMSVAGLPLTLKDVR